MQALVQRSKQEEAGATKEGTMPLSWKTHKRAQKNVDAKWTRKHGKIISSTNCMPLEKRCYLIPKIAITHDGVADTTVFEELLDLSCTSQDVYADRASPH